jgi:hypothetical protein
MFFLGMGLPQITHAQGQDGDFTFEDVFSTRKKKEKVTFHGYAAFQFFDREVPGPGGNNSFDQHIFEPFFGYQINDHVFAKIIIEFEHAPERTDDKQYAEIFIEQAEIDITPWEGTTFAFGAVLVPFGLENYFHSPSDNRLITRPPLVKSGANGNSILNNTWTDVGVQIIQDIPKTGTMDFYVINGSAVQNKDSRGRDTVGSNANSGKSFGAEIQVTELIPGLNFGFSYVTGPHDTNNNLESYRFGLHAFLKLGFAYLQGEYLLGTDEGLGTASFDRDVSGYYVLLSLVPPLPALDNRVDFNVRYTDWTADDNAKNDFSEIAFGPRIQIYKNTWIKAEYQINNENGNNVEIDNNQIGAQLTVLF